MKSKNNFYKEIIKARADAIHEILAGREPDVQRLERETALLVFDVLAGLEAKALSFRAADKYFTDIEYSIDGNLEKKVHPEFSQMLVEAMLLNEIGTKYGANLTELQKLATQILAHEKKLVASPFAARMPA